jgi:hypothetical protein
MTHGSWWSATSLAGITHVLDELRKVGRRPGQIAATKHEDLLMRTVMYRASGYFSRQHQEHRREIEIGRRKNICEAESRA